jgi:hypothetical protein
LGNLIVFVAGQFVQKPAPPPPPPRSETHVNDDNETGSLLDDLMAKQGEIINEYESTQDESRRAELKKSLAQVDAMIQALSTD